jgi:hypothetical protein
MQFEACSLYFGMGNQNQIRERINSVPFPSFTHSYQWLLVLWRSFRLRSLSLFLLLLSTERLACYVGRVWEHAADLIRHQPYSFFPWPEYHIETLLTPRCFSISKVAAQPNFQPSSVFYTALLVKQMRRDNLQDMEIVITTDRALELTQSRFVSSALEEPKIKDSQVTLQHYCRVEGFPVTTIPLTVQIVIFPPGWWWWWW